MRTKTLLLAAAAALAAGISTSQAQVYSANVVGYVNIPVTPNQFKLIDPALDIDGTGTNNTILSLLSTNLATGTFVYVFNGSGYDVLNYAPLTRNGTPVWQLSGTNASTYPLNPGEGFWVLDPTDTNVVETGTVLQGSLTNKYVPATGLFSLVASQVPVAGGVTTTLGYTPTQGDFVYIYNGVGYDVYNYAPLTRNGSPVWQLGGSAVEPQISVGQSFWLNPAASTPSWNVNFTVQ
jgi:hypothetical protein